jgi:hypothetical protein
MSPHGLGTAPASRNNDSGTRLLSALSVLLDALERERREERLPTALIAWLDAVCDPDVEDRLAVRRFGSLAHLLALPGEAAVPVGGRAISPAWRLLLAEAGLLGAGERPGEPRPGAVEVRPVWLHEPGELYWKDVCIKRLRNDAARQRLVLKAFEDQGWPKCLPDPLPPTKGCNRKKRLHDTVWSLNSGLQGSIRFHVYGTGCGFRWEPIP